jgi:multisubunit Na+/H+ antiporter MnhB subunit
VIPTALTRMVARMLLPPTLVVALAILVKGYVDVGDGFSAGVIVALGLLLQSLAFGRDAVAEALPLRHGLTLAFTGLGITAAVLAAPVALGDAPLTHWPPPGDEAIHIGTLEVITAVGFDVGIFLLVAGSVIAILDALSTERFDEEPAPL